MLSFSDIKLGKVVQFNGTPCVIIKCDFLRMQQRKPVKKCTLKNLITGSNIDYSFKSGESIEEADLARNMATFMYEASGILSFMDSVSYETIEIPVEMMSGKEGYLKEGLEVAIVYFNDGPISIDLPIKISYKIIQTVDVDKGNTVQGVMKEATIETGKIVKVPAFIKNGEQVVINTVEDEYSERDTSKK
jgi:elongation factor P